MTLNASGPISLGGSTVGQSVNLELGNAATATASINSTPFRTLAGVPSGAIALSNFYGKSNVTSWVYYLGQYKSTFATGGSIGQVVRNAGWCAGRNSGTVGVAVAATTGSNSSMGVRWLDSTGTLLNIKNVNPGTNPLNLSPCYSLTTDYYSVRSANQYVSSNFLAANGTAYRFSAGFLYLPSWNQDFMYGNAACADSSGNFITSGYISTKTDTYLHILKYTNAGTLVGAVQMALGGGSAQYAASLSVYPRSDGSYACFGTTGTTSSGSGGAYIFSNSIPSSTACTAAYSIANNGGGAGNNFYSTAFDEVNNISYIGGTISSPNQFGIARFNASYTNTTFVTYYDSTDGYGFTDARGLSYYGGGLYFAGGVRTSAGADWTYLVKVDPTTLAVVWAYKYRITGGAVVGIADFTPNINCQATSKGVYFMYTTNLGDQYLFLIGGQPTAGTFTIPSANGGGTFTLTVSAITVTTGNIGLMATSTRSTANGGVSPAFSNYGSTAPSNVTGTQPVGLTNI